MSQEKRTYRYGTLEVEYDASTPIEEVKAAWAGIYADLANADSIQHEDGTVEFVVRAGTKG